MIVVFPGYILFIENSVLNANSVNPIRSESTLFARAPIWDTIGIIALTKVFVCAIWSRFVGRDIFTMYIRTRLNLFF